MKSSEEAVILCKTSIGSLKLEINDLPATKVNASKTNSQNLKAATFTSQLSHHVVPMMRLLASITVAQPLHVTYYGTALETFMDPMFSFFHVSRHCIAQRKVMAESKINVKLPLSKKRKKERKKSL